MSASSGEVCERRITPGTLRVDRAEGRKIKGHAVVVNQLSSDLGGFREIIAPQALERTFREAIDVRAFIDHDTGKVIGRRRAGTLLLSIDHRGLAIEVSPPNTTAANDLLESIERGDIDGMSFAFRIMPHGVTFFDEDGAPNYADDGLPIQTITDMRISEVSVVAMPAYPQTDVSLRSLQEFRESVGHKGRHSKAWWEQWHRTQLARS